MEGDREKKKKRMGSDGKNKEETSKDAKRVKSDESATAPSTGEKREWGSKQPKPVDEDILKYALTTGGEIARRINELKQLEGRDENGEQPDEATAKRIQDDKETLDQLRTAIFNEVKEGEASLACDKRGSRVLQGLIKEGDASLAIEVFERIKPYVGHLVYDSFASHVVQALVNRFSTEESSKKEKKYISGLCGAISKANEWWAMMHDKSATHVARTCVEALVRIDDMEGLDLIFQSLMQAPQSDFKGASRNPQAAPFLAVAIGSMESTNKRETLLARLYSNERNGSVFDRKLFDSAVQDRMASRVMDQCVLKCSVEFVEETIFSKGLEAPYLLRSAKHPFANFVVQRVLERLTSEECLKRALNELAVNDLVDFERSGVLKGLARGLANNEALSAQFVESLVAAKIIERCVQHLDLNAVETTASNESEAPKSESKPQETGYRPAKAHIGFSEMLNQVLSSFSETSVAPLCKKLTNLDTKVLLSLACDPIGGKKLVEAVLDRGVGLGGPLATKFVTHFASLALNSFGVHCARKAFPLLSSKDKVSVMEREIIPSKSKFAGNAQASKFALQLNPSKFTANKKEWLKEIEEATTSKEGKTKKKDVIKQEWEKELDL